MAKEINIDDPRVWLYLGKEFKEALAKYANSDPRFSNMSECGRFLLKLGMKSDKKDRENALKDVT